MCRARTCGMRQSLRAMELLHAMQTSCFRHRIPRPARPLPLLGVLLVALSCTVNPATGRRELVLMSPEREAQLGAAAARQVAEQMGLVEAPGLVAYVQTLGARVAEASPRRDVPYRFHVVDMHEANAFALPGGYIYVSRGLLALTNSEDELANVIAHEVAHVAARHAAQRETSALGVGVLSALGTIAAAALGGADAARTVGELGQVAGAGLIASYGRDQEREADRLGQQMAAVSGWDPGAMATFLRTLESETRLRTGASRRPTFLDSHPATPERIVNASTTAGTLAVARRAPVAAGVSDFLRRLEGTIVGPDPAHGIFREDRFLHRDLDFTLQFPAQWAAQNAPSVVAALSPQRDALIRLELGGRGTDLRRAAAELEAQAGVRLEQVQELRIGALPALHAVAVARNEQGTVALDLTWIAHRDLIFRLSGMTGEGSASSYVPVFAATARSFRPLGATERASIHTLRLGLASSRAGETLAAFSTRTGNAWSLEELAVVNAVPTDRLPGGRLLKIAVRER